MRLWGETYAPVALLATLALGALGGYAATHIGAPLPWLLGSVVTVGALSISGWRPAGLLPQFPSPLRVFFVPIIGVAIGAAFTMDLIRSAAGWWPSLLGLLLYLPLAHAAGFVIYRRLGGFDRTTCFYAATPGGLIESVVMGEEAGGDPRIMSLMQFCRLTVAIISLPLIFMAVEGAAVGSAAGAALASDDAPISLLDAVLLIAAGVIGLVGGRRLGLPAALITGPILISGALHMSGATHAAPPNWLIAITQLVVGVSFGVRFVGVGPKLAIKGLGLAALAVAAALSLASLAALGLHAVTDQSIEAVILSYAPGGVIEMSLIALSLEIGVIFVTAHHIARILIAVAFAKFGARLFGANPVPGRQSRTPSEANPASPAADTPRRDTSH
jgi:membrane AbrB-like protein